MSDRALTLSASLILASLSIACGEKGDGSADQTGGSAGSGGTFSSGGSLPAGGAGSSAGGSGGGGTGEPMSLFSFASDVEGFAYEMYTPGDPTYTNMGADSTIAWDDGEGSDGVAGRVRLDVPFSAPNQLADIQHNFTPAENWPGKTIRARVMIESGFSPDESAPGGAYIFAKTGTEYVWGRSPVVNLLPSTIGTWVEISFPMNSPDAKDETNGLFDPMSVGSVGIQIYTGMGSDVGDPTETVAYVDEFTIE